jgi:hypothetical protein
MHVFGFDLYMYMSRPWPFGSCWPPQPAFEGDCEQLDVRWREVLESVTQQYIARHLGVDLETPYSHVYMHMRMDTLHHQILNCPMPKVRRLEGLRALKGQKLEKSKA